MRNAFIKCLSEFAAKDSAVILLTGDLGFSVFEEYMNKFSQQYINVGISEQSMIGMAAGLAMEGRKVFVYSIIPFLLFRPFEQIRNDLCNQRLNVTLVGVGSGVAYGCEGKSHHAVEDVGIMRCLSGMNVLTPGDPLEVSELMKATYSLNGPTYLRLNRGGDRIVHFPETIARFTLGEPLLARQKGHDVCILAMGNTLPLACDVFDELCLLNVRAAVYSIHTIKPMNYNSIVSVMGKSTLVVTIEEHYEQNGLSELVFMLCGKYREKAEILPFFISDQGADVVGDQDYLRQVSGLTLQSIVGAVNHVLKGT